MGDFIYFLAFYKYFGLCEGVFHFHLIELLIDELFINKVEFIVL